MPTGLPAGTGDVLTAATVNGLVSFSTTTQTADYTPVSADQYQMLVLMNKATAVNFTIPTNASVAFPVGTAITVLNIGAGTCTIKAVTSGTTTISSIGATATAPKLRAQYSAATCIKTGTDTWVVVGDLA